MKALDRIVSKVEEVLAVFAFSAMSIITIVAVFFRYVLNHPLIWSEEASRYLMVWGLLIGISIATKQAAHLGIDVFVSYAPKKIRKVLVMISNILLIVMYVVLVILSVQFIGMAIKTGNVSPILRIPFWQIYLALPIGFGLSTIRGIQVLVGVIKNEEKTEEVLL